VGQAAGRKAAKVLEAISQKMVEAEGELGRIDAVAGDGDHGRGMVKGAAGAARAGGEAAQAGASAADVLVAAGKAWAAEAGGTSGVLWGAGLEAFGGALPAEAQPNPAQLLEAAQAFTATVQRLGKAKVGDKTMVDVLVPFQTELAAKTADQAGAERWQAWRDSVPAAQRAASDTAALVPKIGRARPLAQRSVGTPDAGACSMAMILAVVAGATN
jgi:dihydroxyacetone kinase